jgi:hypothetical protein
MPASTTFPDAPQKAALGAACRAGAATRGEHKFPAAFFSKKEALSFRPRQR